MGRGPCRGARRGSPRSHHRDNPGHGRGRVRGRHGRRQPDGAAFWCRGTLGGRGGIRVLCPSGYAKGFIVSVCPRIALAGSFPEDLPSWQCSAPSCTVRSLPRRRAVAKQGPPPPRSSRMPEPRRGAPRWSDADPANDDEELPPWAGLAIEPRWADQQERPSRPGRPSRPDQPGPPGGQGGDAAADAPGRRPRGRLAAARARKTRRSLVLWGSVLAVAVVIAGGVWQLTRGASGTAPLPDQIVTTFLPGEFQTVPNTCTAVSTATLDQYLPGRGPRWAPARPMASRTACATGRWTRGRCTACWTSRRRPTHRTGWLAGTAARPSRPSMPIAKRWRRRPDRPRQAICRRPR